MVRRKIKCPVCNVTFGDLPQHTRKSHKWDPIKAGTVVSDFGLRKKCETLPDERRRSKNKYTKITKFVITWDVQNRFLD